MTNQKKGSSPKDKEMYESFNPNNPEHLKAFENTMSKLSEMTKDIEPRYLVVPKNLWKKMKKITGSSINLNKE